MRTFITRTLFDPVVATGIVAVVMVVALFVAGFTYQQQSQAAQTSPVIIITATASLPAPQATPRDLPVLRQTLPRLDRAIVAYDAPNGAVIGPIETGRVYRVLRVAGDWLQLDVSGSGAIWTTASALYGVASEPTPTPLVVVVTRYEEWHPPMIYSGEQRTAGTGCGGPNAVPPFCH